MAATLNVHRRDMKTSPKANQLRRQGQIPGVFFGKGHEPVNVHMDEQTILRLLKKGENVVDLSPKRVLQRSYVNRTYQQ